MEKTKKTQHLRVGVVLALSCGSRATFFARFCQVLRVQLEWVPCFTVDYPVMIEMMVGFNWVWLI